jgi:hypothetical protein
MTIDPPALSEIWILERTRDNAESLRISLEDRLQSWLPRITVHENPEDACRAVANAAGPGLTLTDCVGLTSYDGHSVARVLRAKNPLSIIILYSTRAFTEPEFIQQRKEWIDQRSIDFAIPKGEDDNLYATLERVHDLWLTPAAARLRGYITSQLDPPAPFYSAKGVARLSLADLYREILKDTPLGRKTARAWGPRETPALVV